VATYVEIRGGKNLARIARDLKEAGEGGLRRELLRGVRKSTRTAIPDIEASALETLPKRGGLAARVASQKFGSRTGLSGDIARVRIVGTGMKELKDIDAGRLRHPVYGNRKVWKGQVVPSGFFTRPLERKAPAIRRDLDEVMRAVSRKIEKGI
jgi:hypothetical protein